MPLNISKWIFCLGLTACFPALADSLMVQPASLNFYSVQVGQSQAGSISIYNFGNEDLPISIQSYCGGDFWVSTYCPWSLRPGQSCSINASFRPMRTGYQGCSVTVTSDDGGYENISVSGQGVQY